MRYALFACLFVLLGCSSIECPVQNTVACIYQLNDTLKDTLTVMTIRKNRDTITLNRAQTPLTFKLPVSYQCATDTLLFKTYRLAVVDTVWVSKTDIPHFESVDCGVSYFHQISEVRCTHNGIDSIKISKSFIDYVPDEPHLLIYFKARN